MRILTIVVCSVPLIIGCGLRSPDAPLASVAAPDAPFVYPPTEIESVTLMGDKRSVLIRFRAGEEQREQRVVFPFDVADLHYCRWQGDAGLAFAVSTESGELTEFHTAAIYIGSEATDVKTTKIPAPDHSVQLLGITNTSGDSIVVCAIRHIRAQDGERVVGWLCIDNCPTPLGSFQVQVVPFDASTGTPISVMNRGT